MALKLTVGGEVAFPLTSPPKKPWPEPDPKIFQKMVDLGDRTAWVSVPLPDKLEMSAVLMNEHHTHPLPHKKAGDLYKEIDSDMMLLLDKASSGELEFVKLGKQVKSPAKRMVTFNIRYNDADPLERAFLTFQRRAAIDCNEWLVSLNFCPRKAGPAGLAKIEEALDDLSYSQLDLVKILPDFKVSRIDAAVDIIGVEPIDLVAHVPKPGKRMVYVGDSGRPESVYLYQRKPHLEKPPATLSAKTIGPLRMTLYERRDYMLQLGMEPPFGDAPVSRAEVTKRWKNSKPMLRELGGLSNLFAQRRVGYAGLIPTANPSGWKQYCMAAFGAGSETAKWAMLAKGGDRFEKLYKNCPGHLVDETCWSGWQEGLVATGLDGWIDKALLGAS